MNYPAIIVKVPHQRPPTVWRCDSLSELIAAAYQVMGDDFIVHAIPDELADQFDEDGSPITDAAQAAQDRTTTIEDADDAVEVLGHDLHGLIILDSPEEVAREMAHGGSRHQWAQYIGGVEREAIELGWIESADEDEGSE